MSITVHRRDVHFLPDSSRVVARFFNNGDRRTSELIQRVRALNEEDVHRELEHTQREFASRHRNISQIFLEHFEKNTALMEHMGLDVSNFSKEEKLLIGSYGTMEYSIESAAMFNPSIIEDFDQSFLAKGERRVIISFRATGEGHLSSIVFRRGILDANNDFHPNKVRKHIDMAKIGQKKSYDKGR
ncbi:MAG TPA: glycosidase, partial [Pricia sp.]|nr:glycosidase [Pricia sp.]